MIPVMASAFLDGIRQASGKDELLGGADFDANHAVAFDDVVGKFSVITTSQKFVDVFEWSCLRLHVGRR